MFFFDHNPPHIHVHDDSRRPEWSAEISLRSGEVIRGEIPNVALKLVREWMRKHRRKLFLAWERASRGEHPGKISPLVVR